MSLMDASVKTIDGEAKTLASFGAKALLIVNTASECGFTPQYEGLEKLYEKYKGQGLVVVGFPSNDFGAQEPGSETEIKAFCKTRYGVTFPLSSKVKTKGADKSPVYKFLTEETAAPFSGDIKWNFTKFLVDAKGNVLQRFESKVEPLSPEVTGAVEKALK
jgi:glutathione peroxidase